jgi:hypothetical protein
LAIRFTANVVGVGPSIWKNNGHLDDPLSLLYLSGPTRPIIALVLGSWGICTLLPRICGCKKGADMLDFPNSANEVRQLALKLIGFLKKNIRNTLGRPEWGDQNFDLLQRFFGKGEDGLGLDCFSGNSKNEFRWDFVAYIEGRGLLLVAESEWDNKLIELESDFDKLLYPRSPLKLFMCRIRNPEEAERIRVSLSNLVRSNCAHYSSGEIFIIYCVWWAGSNGENRDIAYILQIEGEPNYQPIGDVYFEFA